MAIQTINANGELLRSFDEMSRQQVFIEIEKSYQAFEQWKLTSFRQRKELMMKASEILTQDIEKYGKIITLEMGKPIKQAYSEIEKCAWVCRYYAENTASILSPELIPTDASESYVQFNPLGVVFAVMPWNFPFWQVFRFAAPAIMAGNTSVLKHSSNVPLCALAIEEVFNSAGFPSNIFKTLLVGSAMVDDIIYYPKIAAITLTGSDIAGRKVAESAGKNLKKTVLELGGSDAFIILKDADLNTSVENAVKARIINNGQSCIAAKRFIVVNDIADEFEKRFSERMSNLKVGDPMDEQNELGPIAREDLLDDLIQQLQKSIEKGAVILTGGKRIQQKGYFFSPTVITNVKKGMPVYEQETFGPVAAVIRARDETDAINIANDSVFGLGASIWTKDIVKAKQLAEKIESGSVFINGIVKSDPRLPFGGIKMSGYGRELSHYGIKEFVNIKTVWIA